MIKKLSFILSLFLILVSNSFAFDNSTLKPEYQSLQAYYELNTDSFDSTGRYNGTDYNFPIYTGSAVDFDGVNDIIDTGIDIQNLDSWSVGAFITLQDVNAGTEIFYGSSTGGADADKTNFGTIQLSNNELKYNSRSSTNNILSYTYGPINISQEYFIMSTYDGNTFRAYLDGVEVGSQSLASQIYNIQYPIMLGGTNDKGTPALLSNILMRDFQFYSDALNSSVISDLYNNVNMFEDLLNVGGVGILVNNPINTFNYTFDVESLPISLTTSQNASCEYEYNSVNTSLTSLDNINHAGTFNLGNQTNSSLSYDISFYCQDLVSLDVTQSDITFYRQQQPLSLEIIVPQDQQIFIPSTEEIQFYLETNYVADCKYIVNNDTLTTFSNTNTSIHTTIFNVNSSILTYNSYFQCDAVNFVEGVNKSVVFYLDELQLIQFGFIPLLEDSGTGLGNFLNAITKPIVTFIISMGIAGALIIMVRRIGNVVGNLKGK